MDAVKRLNELNAETSISNPLKMTGEPATSDVQSEKKVIGNKTEIEEKNIGEPSNYAVQSETTPKCCIGYPGKFALDRDLMIFIAGYVRNESPNRKYHRMTADDVFHELKVCDPNLTLGTVVRLLEDAYNKHGYVIKTNGGYGSNPEIPLGEIEGKEGKP